jgi:hypothetical protein
MADTLGWISFAALVAMIGGLAFMFLRHGSKVRPDPDRRHEDGVFNAVGADTPSVSSGGGSDGD